MEPFGNRNMLKFFLFKIFYILLSVFIIFVYILLGATIISASANPYTENVFLVFVRNNYVLFWLIWLIVPIFFIIKYTIENSKRSAKRKRSTK